MCISWLAGHWASLPLRALGSAILHASPGSSPDQAPSTQDLKIGHEYVTSLAYQLYQIASLQDNKELAEHKREATQASNILTRLPLPLFVFNKQQVVTFASDSALSYTGLESAALFGKPIFDAMDLEFPTDFTLESWILDCQNNKVTDNAYWRRVRLKLKDGQSTLRQCDLAGYYNRDNPSGIEFILTVFDRTAEYAADDDSLSFIALAVHELRTPLTLMRGLIEVFEDELKGTLDPELQNFMQRLEGSARQLSSFVTNILNVAKIENNQLTVKLAEESWPDVVKHAAGDMDVKASSLGKQITLDIETKLPTVAVDRLTAYEVVCNLLDNALKYSGQTKEVILTVRKTKDNLVETVVTDKGVGIPTSVLPSLFEKFHRNHRTRDQVGGTGLGLYLSKAIVNAHGGDIWVKSKEGEGTSVGFTLQPYASLADNLKSGNNKDDMVRTAHGWIKNHSLYRR
jgi:signal transduction histidine kinase